MGWEPKVNRHVVYLQQKTVGGEVNYVKRRPAIVTAVNLDDTVDLRVGHDGEVYASVLRRTADNDVEVYVPY